MTTMYTALYWCVQQCDCLHGRQHKPTTNKTRALFRMISVPDFQLMVISECQIQFIFIQL